MNSERISYLERKAYLEQNTLALELYAELKEIIENGFQSETECPNCSTEVTWHINPEDI